MNQKSVLGNSAHHNVNLDFVRGLAALLVVMCHTYECQFYSSGQVPYQTLSQKIFYYFCCMGGDAVMIFFVLSGFLVGGSVVKAVEKSKWSWSDYLVRRLSRLWIVLIPALLLTTFWDSLGIRLGGKYAYDGNYWNIIWVGPWEKDYFDVKTFFKNLFFLQNVSDPSQMFGTNSPLWSLSNEFWYYLLFPLFYVAIVGKTHVIKRIFYLVLFVGVLKFIPRSMAHLGIVWLMGVLAYIVVNEPKLNKIASDFRIFILSFMLFLAVTIIGHLELATGWLARVLQPSKIIQQGLVGIAFTGTIPYLLKRSINVEFYKVVGTWLSKISYTLYLTHLPLMLFFFYLFILPEKSLLTLHSFLLFLFYIAIFLMYGWCVWYFFERRTNEFRGKIMKYVHSFINYFSRVVKRTSMKINEKY